MDDTRAEIADTLRGRILRGLHAGALKRGDRLPSARDLRHEFNVDHRVVVDAYRELEREEIVELRARSGVYVSASIPPGSVPLPSAKWLASVLAQSVAREIPFVELHDWLRRAVETRRLRAVAVQDTADGLAGLCRELSEDYGLQASGVGLEVINDTEDVPPDLRYADLIVCTHGLVSQVRPVAERLRKRLIVAEIRSDLVGGDWRLLLRRPVYVIVKDERFVPVLRHFFADVPGAENIRPLVAGRDSLDAIPDSAPVYVTRSARDALGHAAVAGKVLPVARLFSSATARELIEFIVEANLRAVAADISPQPATGE